MFPHLRLMLIPDLAPESDRFWGEAAVGHFVGILSRTIRADTPIHEIFSLKVNFFLEIATFHSHIGIVRCDVSSEVKVFIP